MSRRSGDGIGERSPLVERMRGFGTTIFSEMTTLAQTHDAVNLGQGFPDDGPPAHVVEAAVAALHAGHHQYAPGPGVAPLRAAIADHQRRFHGLELDPDDEVSVTFGATEGVAASLLALCERGDEVVVLEPTYDAYIAVIALAGATPVRVALRPPGFDFDARALRAAITERTRLVLLNSPHNPTGTMLTPDDLDEVAAVCVEHDLLAVTDEVYEHLVYDREHVPLATRPGMRERTVTVSSASKTFSCTGWKVGWACAPPALSAAVRTTKQFLSFAGPTPLQHAAAVALNSPDEVYTEVTELHRGRRDRLADGLAGLGCEVTPAAGGYFVIADVAPFGYEDGEAFCRAAPATVGVAAVPVSAFVADPAQVRGLVRFAFCKPDDVLDEGLRRLAAAAGEREGRRA